MEEKKIINSEKYGIGKFLSLILLLGFGISAYLSIDWISFHFEYYEKSIYKYKYSSAFSYLMDSGWEELLAYIFIPILIASVLVILLSLWLSGHKLTITDKRVYGKTAFGKRVDLPMDSISAVASAQLFKGITIATSSGKISFLLIKNAKQIHDTLNALLIDRQNKKTEILSAPATTNTDNADQIKKYKDLLDSDIITQEEFDKKKKELLGL